MASKELEIYKCEVCGAMVEVLGGGAGSLVCCRETMTLLEGNTTDAATEKHVPVIERTEGGIKVTVGSVAHPMEEKHHIQWIEIIADGKVCRKTLKPGDAPVACFPISPERLTAREYCNLHGLWKAEA